MSASFNPYLYFPGTTEEAFNYYKTIFGGDFIMMMRFGDGDEANKVSPADKDKIMHMALKIGRNTVLMGTDALESMGQKLNVGNNFYLSINTESRDEADDIFNKLSEGGKVELAMNDTFWGDYFGITKDKFDIQWMISYNEKAVNEAKTGAA